MKRTRLLYYFQHYIKIILLLNCIFFTETLSYGQGDEKPTIDCSEYIFYRCDGIGAHAFYKPHIMVLESGMEAVYYRRLDQYPYARGFRNTFYSITHADKVIRDYGGYKKFFNDQFVPKKTGAFAPNWGWHLLGGGFRSRLLEEYYQHKGFEHARLLSWLTLYVGHLGNEAAQAETADDGSVDPIADLLFFDWVGKLLFTNDNFARFFQSHLHLKEWTFQMAYDPRNKRLVNNGQQYWMRFPISDYFSLSFLTGNMHNSLSFTVNNDAQEQWTLGLGIKPEAITMTGKEPTSKSMSYSIMFAYSQQDNPLITAFYQDNTKLITSDNGPLHQNDDISKSRKLIINLYPKWISVKDHFLGFTFGQLFGGYFIGFTSGNAPMGVVGHTGAESRFHDDL